jgi:hypothetical protein
MARTKQKRKGKAAGQELDSIFLFKLVLYIILGSLWIKITKNDTQIPIPVGLIIGVIFTAHEHFVIDRKIEYAVLLVAMLIGFWAPFGLFIHIY